MVSHFPYDWGNGYHLYSVNTAGPIVLGEASARYASEAAVDAAIAAFEASDPTYYDYFGDKIPDDQWPVVTVVPSYTIS